jgi:hypothetical protein
MASQKRKLDPKTNPGKVDLQSNIVREDFGKESKRSRTSLNGVEDVERTLLPDVQIRIFLEWCERNGAKRHPSLSFDRLEGEGMGNGMTATEDIESETEIVEVPLSLLINEPNIRRLTKEEGGVDDQESTSLRFLCDDLEYEDNWTLVYLFMILQKHSSNAKWRPYFDILPKSFGTPLSFSETEINILVGSNLFGTYFLLLLLFLLALALPLLLTLFHQME